MLILSRSEAKLQSSDQKAGQASAEDSSCQANRLIEIFVTRTSYLFVQAHLNGDWTGSALASLWENPLVAV